MMVSFFILVCYKVMLMVWDDLLVLIMMVFFLCGLNCWVFSVCKNLMLLVLVLVRVLLLLMMVFIVLMVCVLVALNCESFLVSFFLVVVVWLMMVSFFILVCYKVMLRKWVFAGV